ncbi:MAG TPA: cohesin domain-containing protein [Candidatus Sulfotelmatobacter sp.]|nr:cohesin domain-containing protein [Candidatus Sulfotelmatobacter sp.]
MRRCSSVLSWIFIGLALAGCPNKRGAQDYKAAQRAADLQDYDAAVDYYVKALAADPHNAYYRINLNQARFEAGQKHIHNGVKLREKGDLQGAISEFQRAQLLDPSSSAADQELKKSLDLLAERNRASVQQEEAPIMESGQPALASAPPELKPLSRAPINLKMSNDTKVVFDTIGKLAGLTVIYDPDLQARRITTDLTNVTLEQALDIVCLESKTFWKPVTENIIMIIPDQTQKRRDYDEQVVRTFYLSNVAIAQDLTEVTTGLRQLLDLKRIQQVNAQNAIIVRDTPDKLALIDKIIKDIDKAKPEVIIQVEVLEARTDILRNLGILPPQNTSVTLNPNYSTTSSSTTTTTTTNNGIALNQLHHLNQSDVVFTVPSATANFLMTDSATKIVENPEIRSLDGQQAKLNIGDRVPVATGSFQAGVGVGSTAGAGFVNPLVNTQFQYIDVGVNIDVTPHVHPNRDISMKLQIEVSSVTGQATIGGIQQPIISQRKIQQEIRLKEGEVSILGGLIERIDSKTLNGWPWLAKVPVMRYLFSADNTERQDNEDLIVLIPRIVRMPEWTRANLRGLFSGTDTFPAVRKELDLKAPSANPAPSSSGVLPSPTGSTGIPVATPASGAPAPGVTSAPAQVSGPRIRFEPSTLNLSPGQTATLGIVVDNVSDLFSVPMMLQYNPAVLSVEEVRHGGFLSGGTQEIAIVQRVDKEHGQAIISATRQPNTPGVSGSGTLLGVVVKALGPGTSTLSIVQINAKDSQQKPIPLVTSEATLRVQ